MDNFERLYRKMSYEIGYDYETLYETKSEWTQDRGSRHDINAPRKPDIREAMNALLEELIVISSDMNADINIVGARSIGKTMSMPNHIERAMQCFQSMIKSIKEQYNAKSN